MMSRVMPSNLPQECPRTVVLDGPQFLAFRLFLGTEQSAEGGKPGRARSIGLRSAYPRIQCTARGVGRMTAPAGALRRALDQIGEGLQDVLRIDQRQPEGPDPGRVDD